MALLSTDLKGFLENAAIELEEIFNNTCAFPRINQLLVECVGEMTAEIERMRGNAWLLCTSQQKTTTLQKATTVTKSEDVTKTAHVQYIQCLLHHHPNYSNNLTCMWNNVSLHSAISFLCKCYPHVSCWATSVCGAHVLDNVVHVWRTVWKQYGNCLWLHEIYISMCHVVCLNMRVSQSSSLHPTMLTSHVVLYTYWQCD